MCCEVFVSDILPSVRALVARELMETYGMNQIEISKKLGITQPAVSQYKRELRGQKIKKIESQKEIMFLVKNISEKIANQELKPMKSNEILCEICGKLRKVSFTSQSNCRL